VLKALFNVYVFNFLAFIHQFFKVRKQDDGEKYEEKEEFEAWAVNRFRHLWIGSAKMKFLAIEFDGSAYSLSDML
jgi:hypothetical protein